MAEPNPPRPVGGPAKPGGAKAPPSPTDGETPEGPRTARTASEDDPELGYISPGGGWVPIPRVPCWAGYAVTAGELVAVATADGVVRCQVVPRPELPAE